MAAGTQRRATPAPMAPAEAMEKQRDDGPKVNVVSARSRSQTGLDGARLERIVPYMESLVQGGAIPNAMTLVARNGHVAFCRGLGRQNDGSQASLTQTEVALRSDTIFRIYSMSKPITSLALMMLYEEGKFLLSDPLHLHLGPAWRKDKMSVWVRGHPDEADKRGPLVTEACKTTMTVLHVLTHTSGLSYGFDVKGVTNPVDAVYAQRLKGAHELSLLPWAEKLASMPLFFQPGSCWHYGYNTDVCGALVEAISGMPLAEFLQSRVFAPLCMVDTAFWVPPCKRHRFADCYAESPTRPAGQALINISSSPEQLSYVGPSPPVFCSGGGGLVATMHDYCQFCQCIANGGELGGKRLLSVKTVEWMAQNHLPEGRTMDEMAPPALGYSEVAGRGTGFGLGFSVKLDAVAGKQIGSVGEIAWGGAANTMFWVDLEERMFVVWMTQVMGQNRQRNPIREKLGSLVHGCVVDRLPFRRPIARM
jgi:CubicO group peptidase (beta-lactamase class C family)